MNILSNARGLFAKLFRRSQIEDDIESELQAHIENRADDLERSGLSRAEAERRARIEFGGHARFREECSEALGGNFIETTLQDARFSLRLLLKSPGFAVISVATLALAIGANAVVFGVMDKLVLRPLDVPEAENLYGTVYGENPMWQSYPNYIDLRDRNHSFEELAAFRFMFVGLNTGDQAVLSTGFGTSGNYFDVLRVKPYLGRFFHASDEHGPNSAPYVVLSYDYWHSRFADDRRVVGRVIQLNRHPFTIIGVTPPGFRGTLSFISPDFFTPIVNQDQVDGMSILNDRTNIGGIFEAMGHLKPGVTPQQATADVNAIGKYLEKTYPKEFGHGQTRLSRQGLTSFGGPVKAFVAGLMLLAGLILLAACANLGGLFAARAADRSREVALRLALGSSRRRILRALLTEAVMIALAGGVAGLWGSVMLLERLGTWEPFPSAQLHLPVSPDARVYVVALVLALVSGFLFGMVPVRQVMRSDPYQIVKAGPSGRSGRRVAVRDALLVLQVAICAVLVTSSLVAVRGLVRSMYANFGFEPHNVVLAGVNLTMAGYKDNAIPEMQKRMVLALETIPGIESAAMVNNYPPLVYLAGNRTNVFSQKASDLRPANAALRPYCYGVSPGYFRTARTALLAGRSFSWHDDQHAVKVAIVNRDFASKMFGSVAGAVGRYYKAQDGSRLQVVGVVEDGKYQALTEDQQPAVFVPFLQSPISSAYLMVRTRRDPAQAAAEMRGKMRSIDAGLPLDTHTWSDTDERGSVSRARGDHGARRTRNPGRDTVDHRDLWNGGVLGKQAAEGTGNSDGARGTAAQGPAIGFRTRGAVARDRLSCWIDLGTDGEPSSGFDRLPGYAARSMVLTGVIVAMGLLGLFATWIPAQRALSLDPLALLREE